MELVVRPGSRQHLERLFYHVVDALDVVVKSIVLQRRVAAYVGFDLGQHDLFRAFDFGRFRCHALPGRIADEFAEQVRLRAEEAVQVPRASGFRSVARGGDPYSRA